MIPHRITESSQDKLFWLYGEGAHRGKVSLEMSEGKGGALAFVEKQKTLEASQVLVLFGSSFPTPYKIR